MNINGNWVLEQITVFIKHEFPNKYPNVIVVGMNASHIPVILKELWGIKVTFTDF